MRKLFTERQGMNEPRVKEELEVELTKALLTVIINAKIDVSFRQTCMGSANPILAWRF
jgi:hypothetical protein